MYADQTTDEVHIEFCPEVFPSNRALDVRFRKSADADGSNVSLVWTRFAWEFNGMTRQRAGLARFDK